MILVVGVNGAELRERYLAKRVVNAQRQADGYDGVAGKCPRCHRDYLESACEPTACAHPAGTFFDIKETHVL